MNDCLGYAGRPVLALAEDDVSPPLDSLLGVDVDLDFSPCGLQLLLHLDGEPTLTEDVRRLLLKVLPRSGDVGGDHGLDATPQTRDRRGRPKMASGTTSRRRRSDGSLIESGGLLDPGLPTAAV